MAFYQKLVLYYFTGTGNTYRVCRMLQEEAAAGGIEVEVIPLEEASPAQELDGLKDGLLGILTPTHGFTAPWKVIHFVSRMPPGKGIPFFVILTRAGMKLGRLMLPGFEGSGAYLLGLLLALKGYRLVGARGVDMPSNWTSLHPGYSAATARAVVERGRSQTLPFIRRILEGKHAFKGIIEGALGVLLLPVSSGYLLAGRFMLSKTLYANGDCNGCGICARSCPVGAIRMRPGRQRPFWTFKCESCMRCINFCPLKAVEASYPLAAAMLYLIQVPVMYGVIQRLGRQSPAIASLQGSWFEHILTYAYILLSLALAYLVFDQLVRIPIVNRALTLATPTHYYRRYHEKDSRLKDFHKDRDT